MFRSLAQLAIIALVFGTFIVAPFILALLIPAPLGMASLVITLPAGPWIACAILDKLATSLFI
tara:strand:+ start:827 stop:1015 length:189 start_codon:yes stop_codon:yes gene_type:complete